MPVPPPPPPPPAPPPPPSCPPANDHNSNGQHKLTKPPQDQPNTPTLVPQDDPWSGSNTPQTTNVEGSATKASIDPLGAAAELIQHLDENLHSMSASAQSAQEDSQKARQNAKAAMELARKYATRNYETKKKSVRAHEQSNNLTMNGDQRPFSNYNNNDCSLSNKKSKMSTENPSPVTTSISSTAGAHVASPNINKASPSINSKTPPTNNTTPLHRQDHRLPQSNTQSPPVQSTNTTPSHQHQLDQSHAQDVLTLSVELERTKSQLHQIQLRTESNHEQYEHIIQGLEEKVQEAEEDANTALQLARESTDDRIEMEKYLERALTELEVVKEELNIKQEELNLIMEEQKQQQQALMIRPSEELVRKEPEEKALVLAPSKAMISMGRDVLRQRRGVLSRRFQEHKMQFEMRQQDDPLSSYGSANEFKTNGKNDTIDWEARNQRIIYQLKQSARRMGLDNVGMSTGEKNEEDLETLVEQYSKSVEVRAFVSS